MKIENSVCLPYTVIGKIIDDYIESDYEDTCYVGKIEYFGFIYNNNTYKCQIRYLKSYVEWRFYE